MKNEYGVELDKSGYSPSIVHDTDRCYFCGYMGDLARHEAFFGVSYRKKSKALGCWVTICPRCHDKLHNHDRDELDKKLKRDAEIKAMEHYNWSKTEFIARFGKNYI